MCGTCEPLPSPLMGEGEGGVRTAPFSPHPNLPPPRGEGVLTYPCQSPRWGRARVGVSSGASYPPPRSSPARGRKNPGDGQPSEQVTCMVG
jgi:hypothetical protein